MRTSRFINPLILHSNCERGITLETPATYRIRVQVFLDDSWSDVLGGMRVTTSSRGEQGPVTTLEGRVRDQAELIGVLNSLYALCQPILSVELLSSE